MPTTRILSNYTYQLVLPRISSTFQASWGANVAQWPYLYVNWTLYLFYHQSIYTYCLIFRIHIVGLTWFSVFGTWFAVLLLPFWLKLWFASSSGNLGLKIRSHFGSQMYILIASQMYIWISNKIYILIACKMYIWICIRSVSNCTF